MSHSVCGQACRITESIDVTSVALDDYCTRHEIGEVELLKLDVESHEEAALLGASGLLAHSKIKRLLMEYTSGAYSAIFLDSLFRHFRSVSLISSDGKLKALTPKSGLFGKRGELYMLYCEL